MAGDVPAPKNWTLDAWDRAFDWGNAIPKDAAAFLRSQGLQGDFGNLSPDVLRCVGFTKLYETGRIKAPTVGKRARQLEEGNAFFDSIQSLEWLMTTVKDRVDSLRVKESIEISLRDTRGGRIKRFKVRPSTDIKNVREAMTSYYKGVSACSLRLLFNGCRMEDGRTFADYRVEQDDIIEVYIIQIGD